MSRAIASTDGVAYQALVDDTQGHGSEAEWHYLIKKVRQGLVVDCCCSLAAAPWLLLGCVCCMVLLTCTMFSLAL